MNKFQFVNLALTNYDDKQKSISDLITRALYGGFSSRNDLIVGQ